MMVLDDVQVLEALCRATGQWGMYFSFFVEPADFALVLEAAPWLNLNEHGQAIADGGGYILFDSEEEKERVYWLTVGDDGPSETNPYNGPIRVYALTCGPNGQCMNENT